jgi:alpha-L-fucosidase
MVRLLQPDTVLFSDAGPDIRWVGNERGIAGETCWATQNSADFSPGHADEARLNRGDRPGTNWVPAECDVSIRPGWFYHKHEDNQVKTPQQLVELYYSSVGRGASFLLNLPPDRRGRIPDADVESLRGFRRIIDATFTTNLATGARVTASDWRGGRDRRFAPGNVLDGSRITYWATDDGVTTPSLTLDLGTEVAINVARVREHLPLGQRIESIIVDMWQNGTWAEFGRATSVGNCRLIRGPSIKTSRVRLRIMQAAVCPAIAEFGLFSAPS